mmetsp:Transcript_5904/g.7440  ORF Transcript_5904/g.7440 Transcript_5904/m.7440 type:complete len:134 (-) Transcript_5904:34-435(-)
MNTYGTYDVEEKETFLGESSSGTVATISRPYKILRKRDSDADLDKIDKTVKKKAAVGSEEQATCEMPETATQHDMETLDAAVLTEYNVDSIPENDMSITPPNPPRLHCFETVENENSDIISSGAEPPEPPPNL